MSKGKQNQVRSQPQKVHLRKTKQNLANKMGALTIVVAHQRKLAVNSIANAAQCTKLASILCLVVNMLQRDQKAKL